MNIKIKSRMNECRDDFMQMFEIARRDFSGYFSASIKELQGRVWGSPSTSAQEY